jgi:hypothetical protein
MHFKSLRRAGLLVLAVGFLSGCASTAKETDENAEYEYIKVTGSNLRIKVKKGERYDGGTVGTGTMSAPDAHDASSQADAPKGADGG